MKIVLIEDDDLQRDDVCEHLEESIPGALVGCVPSERAFKEILPYLVRMPPDLLIADVMLRWDRHATESTPIDVERGDARGGIRCVEALLEHAETRYLPIIVYTVLERFDLNERFPDNVIFLQKEADLDELVLRVRSLFPSSKPKDDAESWWARLWDAVEAKPGWAGFSFDLKRALAKGRK